MKVEPKTFSYILDNAAIDDCSEQIRSFLKEFRLPNSDVVRYALSAEELLLTALEKADGKELTVTLDLGSRLLRPYIILTVDGKPFNVYLAKETERGTFGDQILKSLGISPEYSYADNKNRYSFSVKKKIINPFFSLIIAIIAAVCIGTLGFFLPDGLRQTLLDGVLTPLHDTFLNILGAIAGPMVFLSVAWGIYGIGDAATLKQVGKKMLAGYIGTVFVSLIIISMLCLPLFRLSFNGTTGGAGELSDIFAMLLGIFPKNIFSPFVDGNTLQIIFLAFVIGIALLFLGQKTDSVAKAVKQINYIVQFLIEFISKLVPYFIFIVLVTMIWSDTAKVLVGVGKLFIVFIGGTILMLAGLVCYTGLKNKVSPLLLARKGFPTLLIALATASSAAAFGTNMKACKTEYGIDDTISSFGIPLGMVTFKPTVAVSYAVITLFFAEMYDIKISVAWLVVMIFTSGILSIATPPIPGGALASYAVLFGALGLPAEALAIALTCDTLVDFICTGGDQFSIPFVLLNQAGKLGMVNRKLLTKKKQ